MAHLQRMIIADDHVAAKIGSVHDDPFGRLLQQTNLSFGLDAIWLQEALFRTVEAHNALPEHFAGWANRLNLFDDITFLVEGVRAWYDRDFIKAVYVLVPQIERGLRSIAGKLGRPLTKPHPTLSDVGVAIGMGDILNSPDLTAALGPDFSLHFLALYADPRGMNLRNRVAHGLINSEAISEQLVRLLIHSLLVLGIWKELAEKRR
jgi:lysyl-tRNA synthetase class 1